MGSVMVPRVGASARSIGSLLPKSPKPTSGSVTAYWEGGAGAGGVATGSGAFAGSAGFSATGAGAGASACTCALASSCLAQEPTTNGRAKAVNRARRTGFIAEWENVTYRGQLC